MICHLVFHPNNIAVYLWVTFFLSNCNKDIHTDIEGVKLNVKYAIIQNGEVTYYPDTIPIFYFKNYVMYNVPRTKTFSLNGELIREEFIFDSFVFESGNKFGFFFREGEDSSKPAKLNVDSFLFERAYRSGFEFDFSDLTLVEKTENKQGVTENYIPKAGTQGFDSLTLSFDKSYKNVLFSFNPRLDSSRESKLVRISMIFGESYSEEYNMKLPRRDFKFEIKKYQIRDPQRVKILIQNLVTRISEA